MAKYFGEGPYPLICPACHHRFETTIERVEQDPAIGCPSCGVITRYDGENVRRPMEGVDRAIDEFKDAVKKASKKLGGS